MLNLIQRFQCALAIVLVVLLLPSAAYAQAAITGVVRDASGAVLPGATVEAASPALIEKVRSVATDGLPVAGYAPGVEGLYLLVTHSGATLAAILGRLVASELLGRHETKLETWRPARFG